MGRTFSVNECALNEELKLVARKVPADGRLDTVEPSTVKQAIADILSLSPKTEIPATAAELRLFDQLYCLMSMKNRKWMTESDLALPYDQMISPSGPKDAELKSRLYGVENRDKPSSQPDGTPTGIELRNYFLQQLKKCLPEADAEAFPHLLTLFDNELSGEKALLVLELRAWSTLTLVQQSIFQAERQARPVPPAGFTLSKAATPAYIDGVHAKIRSALPKLVAQSAWRKALDSNAENSDSVFVRVGLNAAVNRFVREQWGYNRRMNAAGEIQISLLKELEKSAPAGFLHLLNPDPNNPSRNTDYPKLVQLLLGSALEERGITITSKLFDRIGTQVELILQSCERDEFMGDVEINRTLSAFPECTRALTYLALVWCHVCKGSFPEDDPGIHAAVIRLVSSRSALVMSGQHMVSFRRLISPLINTQAFAFPSAYRMKKHIEHVLYLRKFLIDQILGTFKTASLNQWNNAMRASLSPAEFSDVVAKMLASEYTSPPSG